MGQVSLNQPKISTGRSFCHKTTHRVMVERHGTTRFEQRPVGFRIDIGRGLGLRIEQ